LGSAISKKAKMESARIFGPAMRTKKSLAAARLENAAKDAKNILNAILNVLTL